MALILRFRNVMRRLRNLFAMAMVAFAVCHPASAALRFPFHRLPRGEWDLRAINNPANAVPLARGARGGMVLRAAILLDRQHDSPGEIDGRFGSNMAGAVAAWQHDHGLAPTGMVNAPTWQALNDDPGPVLVRYAVTPEDLAGPFVSIPFLMSAKAALPALGYQSLIEALGERFHSSPELLHLLNPRATFATAGEELIVPNVSTGVPGKAALVVVSASDRSVSAYGADERRLARYPATSGSRHDPLPIGEWKINGVARNPVFHYNPDLFWDAQATDRKATIAAGPNNPVGVVWIDLSRAHYGIHGTPEPSTIGKTYSHGCIRLTNWSALELSQMVAPGVRAILQR